MNTVLQTPQLPCVSSSNHFRVRLLSLSLFFWISSISALAGPAISLISPKGGSTSGSPIFYEASASSSCVSGITAMGVETAPGVSAFKVNGAHLETFISLQPGSYNTVLQAWDNCGGVAALPVALTVSSTAGVSVFLPSALESSSPVHFAASAQNPACPKGIASIRIYSAWGNNRYTIDSNKLDALVRLSAGAYSATAQAWDNCGNVFKSDIPLQSLGGDPSAYLYSNSAKGLISQFKVLSNGQLANPNGSGNPPQFSSGAGANGIVIDPSGWFAYTAAQSGIFGYRINRANGALVPLPGSPFLLDDPSLVLIDSAGNFLYAIYGGSTTIGVFRIDRSSGALSKAAPPVSPGPILTALATDINGLSLFAGSSSSQIFGYTINLNTGALSAIAGGAVSVSGPVFAMSTTYQDLYAGVTTGASTEEVDSFFINYGGLLSFPAIGGPVSSTGTGLNPQSLIADKYTRFLWIGNQSPENSPNNFWQFDIDQFSQDLGSANFIDTGALDVDYLTEGYSSNFVYTAGGASPGTVSAWTITASGSLQHLSGPFDTGSANPSGIAVERQHPQ
jgi:hypothetical protein